MAGPRARVGKGESMPRGVYGEVADYDSALNTFELTGVVITDKPTLYILLDPLVEQFILEEVTIFMDFANAVTYQLYLLEATIADDVESRSKIVFDSGAARADATLYKYQKGNSPRVPVEVTLETAGRLYWLLVFSGAPGATSGFIKVRGSALGATS